MIVYLKPRAPFTQSAPRSDTLFGALAWAIRLLYGEGELIGLLEQFDRAIAAQSSPPFLISSLFPFVESESGDGRNHQRTLFLPRPLLASNFDLPLNDRPGHRLFKQLKSSNWMSLGVFDSIAKGELSEAELWEQLLRGSAGSYRLHAGAVMTAEERGATQTFNSLIVTGESVRNSINRLSVSTDNGSGGRSFYTPFVSAQIRSRARTGFFFLIEPGVAGMVEMLKSALRFLGDRGFGGDVSIGRGHCEVEFDDRDCALGHREGEHLVSLSLLHPSPADRRHFARHQHDCLARLERRKGFIESGYDGESEPVWKPTLVMLAEGATFPRDGERRLYGSLFKEQRPRAGLSERLRINGLAYTVPMKLSGPLGEEVLP